MTLLYSFDFRSNPIDAGWRFESARADGRPVFIASEGFFPDKGAKWKSPLIRCAGDPNQYYRLSFRSRAARREYWAVFFYDNRGIEITSDIYASICPSTDFVENRACFRGRPGAASFVVSFMNNQPMTLEDVRVETVDLPDVLAWADALYATLPPISAASPQCRSGELLETRNGLRSGKALRLVMLGDSIVNDTNNSLFDALLRRLYPQSNIHVVPSINGSTGCWKYRDDPFFETFVSAPKPDLLMIGGISHRQDLESIATVIQKVRRFCPCDILLTTGPVGRDLRPYDERAPDRPLPPGTYAGDPFNARMRDLAETEKVAFLDMNTLWHSYIAASEKPWEWFHRDALHANDRGKQILGRLLEAYFRL